MSESITSSEKGEGKQSVGLGPKSLEIPAEWEVKQLAELVTNSGSYGANVSAVDFDPEKPRYIRITDIGDDGFLKDDDKKSIPEEEAEGYFLSDGDLVFARTGATVGKSYLYRGQDSEAAYAGYLIRFVPDEAKVDPDYLAYFAQSRFYRDWVARITRHGAQQNINASEYRGLEVIYPPLPEQRGIADVLSIVDKQIQQTDTIIKETQKLKRGLMQDLFVSGNNDEDKNQEVSLGPKSISIPDSWSTSTIDEMTEKVSDGTHNSPETQESGRPYLTSKNIREWGFDFSDLKYVSEEDFQQINSRCEPQQGDVLYVKDGANTGIAQVNTIDFDFCLLSSVALIRPSEQLSARFLQQQLSWGLFKQVMAARMSGTGIKRLTIDKIKKSKILVPPLSEQERIASVLTKIDDEIAREREVKQKLQELKRGLMQDLLIGEVRVSKEA